MAADRVQELLVAERDGKLSEQQRIDMSVLRKAGEFPAPLTKSAPGDGGVVEFLRQVGGIIDPMGEYVTATLSGEKPRLEGQAFALRTAPGLIPNPIISSAASMAGEYLAQGAEGMMGERQAVDPTQIVIAGAAPIAATGIARGARAVGRTAQRLVPGLFEAAQRKALTAATKVIDAVTPPESVQALFRAARSQGSDHVGTRATREIVEDLTATLPAEPTDAGLRQVRDFMASGLKPFLESGNLDDLMRARLDLGRMMRRANAAPELGAIYKGLLTDLEAGVAHGGAGATAAKQALGVFKKDLGALRLSEFVEQSKAVVRLGGADTPALNINRFASLVNKERDELAKQLGADGLKVVDAFIHKFRSLPPTHALTAWNTAMIAMFGGGGAIAGGPLGAAAGAAGMEVGRNLWAVGKNPTALNQLMTSLAHAARQLHMLGTPLTPETEIRVNRLGDPAAP